MLDGPWSAALAARIGANLSPVGPCTDGERSRGSAVGSGGPTEDGPTETDKGDGAFDAVIGVEDGGADWLVVGDTSGLGIGGAAIMEVTALPWVGDGTAG